MHTRRARDLTTLVVALTALAGTARANAQAPGAGACALFTVEEAAKATGRTLRRARPGTLAEATTCSLSGGTGSSIGVTLSPSTSKKTFDEFRALLAEQGEKPEPVSGVGDDAYYWGTRIYVRARNQLLVIDIANEPEAVVRPQVLALAKLGVPRLK